VSFPYQGGICEDANIHVAHLATTGELGLQFNCPGRVTPRPVTAEFLFGECKPNGEQPFQHGPHEHDTRGPLMRCLGWPVDHADVLAVTEGAVMGATAPTVESAHSFQPLWSALAQDLEEWAADRFVDGACAQFPSWEEAVGYLIPTLCNVLGPAERFALLAGRMFRGEPITEEFSRELQAAHAELESGLSGKFTRRDPKEGK
jgi:hypothetical protein